MRGQFIFRFFVDILSYLNEFFALRDFIWIMWLLLNFTLSRSLLPVLWLILVSFTLSVITPLSIKKFFKVLLLLCIYIPYLVKVHFKLFFHKMSMTINTIFIIIYKIIFTLSFNIFCDSNKILIKSFNNSSLISDFSAFKV